MIDVAGIDHGLALAANTIAKYAAGVLQSPWKYGGVIAHDDLFPIVDLFDQEVGVQIRQGEWKVGIDHLTSQDAVEPSIYAALAQNDQPTVP
jgi:hypothetical protein